MDELTQECGCTVEEVWVDSFKVAGYNIIYCPRHAAADAMYDALKDLAPPITYPSRFRKGQAALDLADGSDAKWFDSEMRDEFEGKLP